MSFWQILFTYVFFLQICLCWLISLQNVESSPSVALNWSLVYFWVFLKTLLWVSEWWQKSLISIKGLTERVIDNNRISLMLTNSIVKKIQFFANGELLHVALSNTLQWILKQCPNYWSHPGFSWWWCTAGFVSGLTVSLSPPSLSGPFLC